jgi:hypothetical protein
MNSDIKRYLSLRDSLIQEKTKLEQRLAEISEALGNPNSSVPSQSPPSGKPATSGRVGRRGPRGSISLREAVLQVTSKSPLTKEEILNQVRGLGYRFSTSNPLNSLGVILYGKNPRFKNEDGRFSPMGGASGSTKTVSKPNGKKAGRRQMSPEARERIAAAQRARWAKRKSGK